jgi:putative membrane protein
MAVLHPGRQLAGAGGMLLTSMHMTLLGALLILAARPLYPSAICGGPADQQLGGMIMLGLGTPIYLLAGLVLTARALGQAERTA